MQLSSAVAATRAPACAASRCPTARTIQIKASPLRQPHRSLIRLRQASSVPVRAPRQGLQAAAADVDGAFGTLPSQHVPTAAEGC